MTIPDPAWCARLAAALSDTADRVGWLAAQVGQDWGDRNGREWVERAGLVQRELAREAVAAAELGARAAAVEQEPAPLPPLPRWRPRVDSGVRLGGTDGTRPDDALGPRLPDLPPPP